MRVRFSTPFDKKRRLWARLDDFVCAALRLDKLGHPWTSLDILGLNHTRSLLHCRYIDMNVHGLDMGGLLWTFVDTARHQKRKKRGASAEKTDPMHAAVRLEEELFGPFWKEATCRVDQAQAYLERIKNPGAFSAGSIPVLFIGDHPSPG